MKIISITILLFISLQVCGQDIITHEYNYEYQGRVINRKEVKKLIINSQEKLAKKYLSRSKIRKTIGWSFIAYGSLISIETLTETGNYYDTGQFAYGLGAAGVGILAIKLSNSIFKSPSTASTPSSNLISKSALIVMGLD